MAARKDPTRTGSQNGLASWGGDAPQNELSGSISPTIFPGLNSAWYVELRLR